MMSQWLTRVIEYFGEQVLSRVERLGRFMSFNFSVLFWMFKPPFRWKLFISQMEFVGNRSLFIVILTSTFSGMVMAYQTYLGFKSLNADSFIGPVVAISMAKELAPVFTGLIIAGRCGAAMAAQIGSMKVTEQLDALEVMGINTFQYLAVPRVLAGFLALPMLACIFLLVGNIGSWFIGTQVIGIDEVLYFSKLGEFLKVKHIIEGLIKSAIFGYLVALVGCYHGFQVRGGAEGVGRGTNMAVIWGMVMVLVLDFFLTSYLTKIL